MSFPRDFKGIWIPKELWFDDRLSIFEKCLIAEVDSLDGENHCYARNDHFEKLFNVSERTISQGFTKLTKLGFVEVIEFDGRNRKLKSNLKTIYAIFYGAASQSESSKQYFTGQTRGSLLGGSMGESIEKEIPLEIPLKDISKDISKKRIKKPPEPKIEREPRVFTSDYEHRKLVEKIGNEKDIENLYIEISRWKEKEGIDGGDDYRTALKWQRPKQKKIPLAKKDNSNFHDDSIITWKFIKELEETDALAAKHELNKLNETQKERYGRWRAGTLYATRGSSSD